MSTISWTVPRTWVAKETVTAALMNTHVRDNLNAIGGAWTSYTPTLAQGASTNIAKTVNYAKYLSIGKLIIVQMSLSATGSGTAGSAITASIPVAAATSNIISGSGRYADSGTATYSAIAFMQSTSLVALERADAPSTNRIGVDPNIAVASGDAFFAAFTYEAA